MEDIKICNRENNNNTTESSDDNIYLNKHHHFKKLIYIILLFTLNFLGIILIIYNKSAKVSITFHFLVFSFNCFSLIILVILFKNLKIYI